MNPENYESDFIYYASAFDRDTLAGSPLIQQAQKDGIDFLVEEVTSCNSIEELLTHSDASVRIIGKHFHKVLTNDLAKSF